MISKDRRVVAFNIAVALGTLDCALRWLIPAVRWHREGMKRVFAAIPGWHLLLPDTSHDFTMSLVLIASLGVIVRRTRAWVFALMGFVCLDYLTFPSRVSNLYTTIFFAFLMQAALWGFGKLRDDAEVVRGLRWIFGITYFAAGLHKLNSRFLGWSDQPSPGAMSVTSLFRGAHLSMTPGPVVIALAVWGTIAIECGAPALALNSRPARKFAVATLILFNAMIACSLGILDYPWIATAFLPLLFEADEWEALGKKIFSRAGMIGAAVGAAIGLWFSGGWGPLVVQRIIELGIWGAALGALSSSSSWTPALAAILLFVVPAARADGGKKAFFGDIHIHTARSLDAWVAGNPRGPSDAFQAAREAKLDFAAVTDHSEFLGVTWLCAHAEKPYDFCAKLSALQKSPQDMESVRLINGDGPAKFCDDHATDCRKAALAAWGDESQAAEHANDAGRFTTLPGYEWTLRQGGQRHRTVLFGSAKLPELPFDSRAYSSEPSLWEALAHFCGTSCDILTIPHNTNLSDGTAFQARSPLAAKFERLVEVFQSKGNSECANPNDPECAFEHFAPAPHDTVPLSVSSRAYVREGLEDGLLAAAKGNADPVLLGFVGGTDNHSSSAGPVPAEHYRGPPGDLHPEAPLNEFDLGTNPGGLTGVWADENTRPAIFSALARRETFATSGPRITLRFYETWSLGSVANPGSPGVDPCSAGADTAMGGVLSKDPPRSGAVPQFVVQATKDGVDLDRVEIIKAVVRDGKIVESRQSLAVSKCAVWEDLNFRPGEAAFWYARVLEKPTWRWDHFACQKVKKSDGKNCEGQTRESQRAWSSPIWHLPH